MVLYVRLSSIHYMFTYRLEARCKISQICVTQPAPDRRTKQCFAATLVICTVVMCLRPWFDIVGRVLRWKSMMSTKRVSGPDGESVRPLMATAVLVGDDLRRKSKSSTYTVFGLASSRLGPWPFLAWPLLLEIEIVDRRLRGKYRRSIPAIVQYICRTVRLVWLPRYDIRYCNFISLHPTNTKRSGSNAFPPRPAEMKIRTLRIFPLRR